MIINRSVSQSFSLLVSLGYHLPVVHLARKAAWNANEGRKTRRGEMSLDVDKDKNKDKEKVEYHLIEK